MTGSIDVNNSQQEYMTLLQKNLSSEEHLTRKVSRSSGGINIVKNQMESYIKNSNSDTEAASDTESMDNLVPFPKNKDKDGNYIHKAKNQNSDFITNAEKKLNTISYGAKDTDEDVSTIGDDSYSIMSSYGSLAAAVGANGRGITKTDLVNYLQKVSSGTTNGQVSPEVIAFLKNLIAQFDSLSGGGEYLTSLSGTKEPQDYSTVTKEQVTSPIDIRI